MAGSSLLARDQGINRDVPDVSPDPEWHDLARKNQAASIAETFVNKQRRC
jgi:hypothetical protein